MPGNGSSIIFKSKQLRIILALRDVNQSWFISTLAKASDTTYVHACNFITTCERMGIMTSERHGKVKQVKLTEKGLKIAELLANSYSMMNMPQEAQKQQAQPAEAQKS